MTSCAFQNCKNSQRKKIKGIAFHRFPVDEDRKLEWVKAVGRVNWFPKESARVCSAHFKDSDFIISATMRKGLKRRAIPVNLMQLPKNFSTEQISGMENTELNSKTAGNLTCHIHNSSRMENTKLNSETVGNLTSDIDNSRMETTKLNSETAGNLTCATDNSSRMQSTKLSSETVGNLTCAIDNSSRMQSTMLNSETVGNLTCDIDNSRIKTTKLNSETAMNLTCNMDNSSRRENTKLNSKTAKNLTCDMDTSSINDLNHHASAIIENVLLRRKLQRFQGIKIKYKKRISSLQTEINRQRKKIQDIKSLIDSLKKN